MKCQNLSEVRRPAIEGRRGSGGLKLGVNPPLPKKGNHAGKQQQLRVRCRALMRLGWPLY